jgi:nitrite reductase/ring-hydroxylating ferredoxin subunit
MLFRKKKAEPDGKGYWEIMPASDIHPDAMTPAEVGDTPIILTRFEGKIIAFARHCPHASGDFMAGDIRRNRVYCFDHDYKFDICTGRILSPPDEPYRLKRYDVKEVNGMVKVRLV